MTRSVTWHFELRIALIVVFGLTARAQEAASGFDLRATVSAGADFSQSASQSGYRAVFYPVLKVGKRWSLSGAYQINSANFYPNASAPAQYFIRNRVLQASVNYSLVHSGKSLMVRAGRLPTAFGSFPLRYDDTVNPLVTPPPQYGYYYSRVSTLGVTGAQADVTVGKWDARLQFATSNPANPRPLLSPDQYGNWAGGAGYTVRQGLRLGASASYGPYLDRGFQYYFPGEAPPAQLKARAEGIDAQWARGHWSLQGEWDRFTMPYRAIPVFREQAGYIEARRVISPRWYAAARVGYAAPSAGATKTVMDAAGGYRISSSSVLKLDYQMERDALTSPLFHQSLAIQVVASVHPLSLGFR